MDRVGVWWAGYEVEGNASFILATKLGLLKEDIKLWNREVFGNVRLNTTKYMEEVRRLDEKESRVGLTREEKRGRGVKRGEIGLRLMQEEISWRQKSRALWLREGNSNTKFFHTVASTHRRINHIGKIEVGGVVFEDDREVRGAISEFYEDLFRE